MPQYKATHGEWQVTFTPASAKLTCRHKMSGAVVEGQLSFEATIRDSCQACTFDVSRDTVADRLAIIDPAGDVQGYLHFAAKGGALRILCMHRAAQNYPGLLTFEGEAQLGAESFACRTTPAAGSNVVQMATGPADSALNDSIFDIAKDVVLRLDGDSVSLTTTPGKKKPAFPLRMTARPEAANGCALAFEVEQDYYRSRYVPHYKPLDKKRLPTAPTGWMSWNVYFDQAGEEENLAEARVAARFLRPFGLQIWSIESWQDNSATLPVRHFHNLNLKAYEPQFPHGMKWLADQIRALGFMPGIWTAPFGTGNEEFYRAHKSWFLHDTKGRPMSNWCGLYLLDPSQPAVRQHMKAMHRTMAKKWGYEFFKIDGMSGRSKSYSAHFFERPEVRKAFKCKCENPFGHCVKAFREGIGRNAIFLACQGHYSGPEVEHADAARIGADIVSPNQPSQWHNVLAQAKWTLNQLFVNNIIWYCDPDTLLVGDYHPIDTARITTTIVALPGQLMFAGDKLGALGSERMRLLQQALPVCDVRPLDLFPIFDMLPVWDLKVRRPFGEWDVVSLFNWDNRKRKVGFTFEEIGLPAGETYLVYDFWNKRFVGAMQGGYTASLPGRSSRLLAVHRSTGAPQFLSTDRHITQGAVSLEDLAWDEKAGMLTGRVRTINSVSQALVFHIPDGFEFKYAKADCASAVDMRPDGTLVMELINDETASVRFEIHAPR
ncbi:MAG: hypothetical protein GXP25_13135 [Planctomycetes bacterium]|nr:hypothetical protein [Planctomycetota bacterium]